MPSSYNVFAQLGAADSNAPVLSTLAVTGVATIYSLPWTGEDADGYGLTVFTTGTLTGTWTLWMTDKTVPDTGANDNDWVQDTIFAPTNPAGAASKFRDDGGNAKAFRKRLKYVNASGTGTVQAFVTVPKSH